MEPWGFCQKNSCESQSANFVAKHIPLEISGLEIVSAQKCLEFLDHRLNFDAKYDICVAKKLTYSLLSPTFKVSLK